MGLALSHVKIEYGETSITKWMHLMMESFLLELIVPVCQDTVIKELTVSMVDASSSMKMISPLKRVSKLTKHTNKSRHNHVI